MEIKHEAMEKATRVRLLIFDVDGVLTDGGIYMGEAGEVFKPFNCKDGLGITLAHRAGLLTAIITGRTSVQLLRRAGELHITELMQGQMDKRSAYGSLKEKYGLRDEEIAYLGDDLIDLPVMLQVGLPVAVADASPEVREVAALVTDRTGGHGAARELIEFILKAQGRWQALIAPFYDTETPCNVAQPEASVAQ